MSKDPDWFDSCKPDDHDERRDAFRDRVKQDLIDNHVAVEEPWVYDGRDMVCEKHGHKLIAVYKDGYDAICVAFGKLQKENERLNRKVELLNDEIEGYWQDQAGEDI